MRTPPWPPLEPKALNSQAADLWLRDASGAPIAVVGVGVAPVGDLIAVVLVVVPQVRGALALVGPPVPLVGRHLAQVGQPVTLVGDALTLVGRELLRSSGSCSPPARSTSRFWAARLRSEADCDRWLASTARAASPTARSASASRR